MRIAQQMILCCVPLGCSLACHAGDAVSNVPSQGPRIMLYVHQPLWFHGAPRTYGLRLEQTTAPSSSPAAAGVGTLQRREILNLEFGPHTETRLELGRKLTWDVGRREFGLSPLHPNIMIHLPSQTALRLEQVSARP
jgi:hypothetical protein